MGLSTKIGPCIFFGEVIFCSPSETLFSCFLSRLLVITILSISVTTIEYEYLSIKLFISHGEGTLSFKIGAN